MTILEARPGVQDRTGIEHAGGIRIGAPRTVVQRRPAAHAEVWPLPRDVVVRRRARSGPPRRPGGAPLRFHGTGVLMSRASHRRRPITPVGAVLLALLAGGITLWLGLLWMTGGVQGAAGDERTVELPTRLSVVEVQAGETLQHIAHRVAPDAPADSVVERIRELNKLETATVLTGQTLIAPIG